jgi:bifunctional DNA-binding transcriptional regulator/antitoxin component of YhaV-PrlF toxin-antitoxin module
MPETTLAFDARGRVTIPRHLREGLGDRVVAIRTPHGLVLHPVPKHVHLPAPAKGISGEDAASSES